MNEKTYLLSPLYSLPDKNTEDIDIDAHPDEEVRQLLSQDIHFLSDDKKGKLFIINPTIRAFLKAFTAPTTLELVTRQFASQVQCTPEQIAGPMSGFFDDMRHRGVLVDFETAQRINHIDEAETEDELLFEIGEQVEGYQIEAVISQRRRVQLFLARELQSGKKAVVKVAKINERVEDEHIPGIVEDFGQEFCIMRDVGYHPNVCQLISYNNTGRKPFAIMEYAEGVSVRKYLKQRTPSLKSKLKVIRQIFAAIAHVQQQQVIHGDIHSGNFLINEQDSVKLIDFDLSNRENPRDDEYLRKGGVYDYIPPERTRVNAFSFMSKEADYCSEVFQLGVIMFFVLYGELPFSGFTWKQLAHKINTENPELKPRTLAGETIPPAFLHVLEKAIRKSPEERFANATALHTAFLEAEKGAHLQKPMS